MSEAPRLADKIQQALAFAITHADEAAAKLRTQHAEIERLGAELAQAQQFLGEWKEVAKHATGLATELASGAQPAPSVPEGWKLVPVDPTDEMIVAIRETHWKVSGGQLPAYREVYAAMLAAAPEAPKGKPLTDKEIIELSCKAGVTFIDRNGETAATAPEWVARLVALVAERAAAAAPKTPDTEALAEAVTQALYRAWELGIRYWRQVDSEHMLKWKEADETHQRFQQLVAEGRSLVLAGKVAAPGAAKPVSSAQHIYNGDCPDENQPAARDPQCHECRAMDALSAESPTAAVQPGPRAPWISLADRMPDPDKHDRVLIYTEGYDFGGEQVFDVKAETLNECRYTSPDEQPETCKAASHWMPHPRDEMLAMNLRGLLPAINKEATASGVSK